MSNEDQVRQAFLKDLDDADHIILTAWEAEFVGNLAWHRYDSYTEKQQEHIDKLRKMYESKI